MRLSMENSWDYSLLGIGGGVMGILELCAYERQRWRAGKGIFFGAKLRGCFLEKKGWVRMNFPFSRCLLIATKTGEQFFVHSFDSVHNNGQKKRERLRVFLFVRMGKKRSLRSLPDLLNYKFVLCPFSFKITGYFLYFQFKILTEDYFKTVWVWKSAFEWGREFFCSKKEKEVFFFLGKSRMSLNSVGKSILTVKAFWCGWFWSFGKYSIRKAFGRLVSCIAWNAVPL